MLKLRGVVLGQKPPKTGGLMSQIFKSDYSSQWSVSKETKIQEDHGLKINWKRDLQSKCKKILGKKKNRFCVFFQNEKSEKSWSCVYSKYKDISSYIFLRFK